MDTIPAKTIVTRSKSTAWFGALYNMNIYRGCCHGCIYCDSRSDCYRTPDFDHVRAKEDALRIIRDDLRSKAVPGVVATGAMSDPYNPFEEKEELTRHALELLNAYGFGVAIATKSDLILRDLDILKEIATHSPVLVKLTITTADDQLCAKVEPHVARSSRRFEVLQALHEAGIFAGVLLMPVLPFLEDSPENITAIVERTAEAGGRFIYPALGVTLRENQREYFFEQLDKLFPEVKAKYLRQYGSKYQCAVPHAKELWALFTSLCRQTGLLYKMEEIVRASRMGYEPQQLTLF